MSDEEEYAPKEKIEEGAEPAAQEEKGEPEIKEEEEAAQKGICNPHVLEESVAKKEKNEREKKEAEYHNCIFIDGKDFNSVINSGEIFGGINQSDSHKEKGKNIFLEKADLADFMESHQKDGYASILITLSVLKLVPEQNLFRFSERLRKILAPEGTENEEKISVAFQSVEEVLKVISSDRIEAIVNTAAGKIPVRCLVLKDTSQIETIEKAVWNNYPGMRDGLICWLREMSRENEIRRVMLCQIAEALGDFASFDFTYTQNKIIPLFVDLDKKDNFYFLTKIAEACLKSDSCGEFADSLLKNWCYTDELWKIPLYLYRSEEKRDFHRALEKKLRSIIREELLEGIELEGRDYEYIFLNFSQIPFELLQENDEAAGLYAKVLSENFQRCDSRKKKMRFGYYFCGLLLQDFLAEGYPFYRCALIHSFNKKDLRAGLTSIATFVWGKSALREIAADQILRRYIQEMDTDSHSWEYEKSFLKSLAFTGQKEDFYNLIRMLERREIKGRTADEMKRYLEELLEQRRKRR